MKPSPIRVAHFHLQARRYNWRDVRDMEPEKALSMLEDLSREAGRKAREYIQHYRADAREALRNADALEKAWDKWDWEALARFNVVTDDEAQFALEVLANYTP